MERLGRYELLRVLGSGGMGVVYEALLRGPGDFAKPVAVKVLHGRGQELLREARLGGLLRHENLVEVYDVGEVDGAWYCAMELIPDGSLSRRAPLPPRAVVEVGIQVCAGLSHAWREIGLVHLDLKPSNLLMDGATVKIADFGIARARGTGTRGRVEGTRGYMSPEQARGEEVDARSDIFSLGVVLRVLATGKRPSLASQDTFSWEQGADQEIPAEEGGGWLAPVLARCLAPDPQSRFPSADDLAEALRALSVPGPGLQSRESTSKKSGFETDKPRTNVGAEPDAFVGREAELASLLGELSVPGLVTLKGPGGVGKTRLSRRIAREFRTRTGGQAWFCDLSAARDRDGILAAIGATLELPPARDLAARVGAEVAGRGAAVVVLDNAEQVSEALGGLLPDWLAAAPEARWLVTSREPVRLRAERVIDLLPLPAPDALALLRARCPAGTADPGEEGVLAELADRLDGLPLALELAAARIGVLGPARVLARLGDRLTFLRSRARDVSERQATLRGALDWSWDLLSEDERAALAALSAFEGGFTAEAAEAILGLPRGVWALDVLESLADRSLLQVRGGRMSLLESVRIYAAERLEASGERDEVWKRHGAFFADLGTDESLEVLVRRQAPRHIAARLPEMGNLEAAVRRAVDRGDPGTAAPALRALAEIVTRRGPLSLAVALGEVVLTLPGISEDDRASVCLVLAHACRSGDLGRAMGHYADAIRALRGGGRRIIEGRALSHLGLLLAESGRADESSAAFEEALGIARAAGDRALEGSVLGQRARLFQMIGRWEDAAASCAAALAVHREVGNPHAEGAALSNLALLYEERGDLDRAISLVSEAIPIYRGLGDRRGLSAFLGNLAMFHYERADASRGDLERADLACAEALALARESGDRRFEGTILRHSARLRKVEGAEAEARRLYEQAAGAAREVGDALGEGISLGELARMSPPNLAGDLLLRARALLEASGDRDELATLHTIRAEIAWEAGDRDAAVAALAEARAVSPPRSSSARAIGRLESRIR